MLESLFLAASAIIFGAAIIYLVLRESDYSQRIKNMINLLVKDGYSAEKVIEIVHLYDTENPNPNSQEHQTNGLSPSKNNDASAH